MAESNADHFSDSALRRGQGRLASALDGLRTRTSALLDLQGSLKTHLFIFAAALILPLLVVVGIALFSIVNSNVATTRQQLIRTAGDISGGVDREVLGYLTVLKTLATSPDLEDGDLRSFHARAKAALRDRPADVLLLDKSFQQLVNTRVPFGTQLPKTADEESARIVVESRESYVSNVFLGTMSGRHVINIEVPVLRRNAVKYVLLITVEIEHFADILSSSKAAQGYTATLSDREGQVISLVPSDAARTVPPRSQRQERGQGPGILDYEDGQGVAHLEASVWSDVTGWRTGVIASRSQIDSVWWTSIKWFCLAMAVAALTAAVLGTLTGRRLARPIAEIKRATIDLARERPVEVRQLPLTEANDVMNLLGRAGALIATRTTRLRESEERSREQVRQIDMLMRELAHRNRNQFSVILAMARQLGKTSGSVTEFQSKFSQRIAAMAQAQSLLLEGAGVGVSLKLLIANQMKPFVGERSPRVIASGPDAFLTADAARTIGMAFHELATNATKYGALTEPQGRVCVTWSISEPDQRLKIVWQEDGGPQVGKPSRAGFGHTIIEKYVSRALRADVTYIFEASGVVWTLEARDILA